MAEMDYRPGTKGIGAQPTVILLQQLIHINASAVDPR